VGTCEAPARIVWLAGKAAVEPKDSAYAQIVTSQPVAAFRGDRFVLRDQTASRTLGGGVVVDARARKPKSGAPGVEPLLQALQSEDEATRLQAYLRSTEALGTPAAAVASELGIDGESLRRLCDAPEVVGFAAAAPAPLLAARERFDAYAASVIGAVRAHHETYANEPGIDLEKLRLAGVERVDARVFRALIDELAASAKLVRRGNIVAAASHRVALDSGNEAHASTVLEAVRRAALMPPTLAQLGETLGLPSRTLGEIVGVLVERGALVRVSADLVFAKEHLDDVAGRLRAHLEREREITAAGFRDLIGASRKYSIPLLDYFDRSGLTLRSGDVRRLRGR
jgi:selenocysteine-specific elongation factor